MLLLLQLSLVVIVLRFPAWIFIQHNNIIGESLNEIKKRMAPDRDQEIKSAENTGSGSEETVKKAKQTNAKSRWKRAQSATIRIIKIERKSKSERMVGAHSVIEVCYFGFVEGADAFSLVDEVITHGDYFAADERLTDSLLLFIAVTLILASATNFLSYVHEWSAKISLFTKLGVVIVSNFPFFVIRIYLAVLYSNSLTGSEIDTVFLLFTVKEFVTLLLAGVEVGIQFHSAKLDGEIEPA